MHADLDRARSISLPHLEGVTHSYVDVGAIRLHVAEAGAGEPVLLLHGWPQSFYCWRKVIPSLARDFRLICPDLRGFGWSDAPAGRYHKRVFAADALALLDVLGLERVNLIAHDWGAWAGFQLCLDHPERIGRYLALNMTTPWPEDPSLRGVLGLRHLYYQALLAIGPLARRLLQTDDFIARVIRAGAVHRDAWSAADLEVYAAVLRQPERIEASTRLYRTFLTEEFVPYLKGDFGRARLEVPTLLLHGLKDPAVDHRNLGRWQANSDDMAVECRPDAAHFIAEELPDLVLTRARALFGGMSPRQALSVDG